MMRGRKQNLLPDHKRPGEAAGSSWPVSQQDGVKTSEEMSLNTSEGITSNFQPALSWDLERLIAAWAFRVILNGSPGQGDPARQTLQRKTEEGLLEMVRGLYRGLPTVLHLVGLLDVCGTRGDRANREETIPGGQERPSLPPLHCPRWNSPPHDKPWPLSQHLSYWMQSNRAGVQANALSLYSSLLSDGCHLLSFHDFFEPDIGHLRALPSHSQMDPKAGIREQARESMCQLLNILLGQKCLGGRDNRLRWKAENRQAWKSQYQNVICMGKERCPMP
ncbi:uncharacterized protein LOC129329420 [Eublepharis macularius]|uniref:Uncharacterized protein LOC129329420 n=1 Tax=Eublepharis macularius TaxID=481883 RepID=A0AA97JBF7_EUBMA|nr:uncharacterized protein LOC129329420 [Eublepharis macularius]